MGKASQVRNGDYKSFVTYEPEENIGLEVSYNLILSQKYHCGRELIVHLFFLLY